MDSDFGRYLVSQGLISPGELASAHRIQQRTGAPLAWVLQQRNDLAPEVLDEAVREFAKHARVGEILVAMGAVGDAQLAEALARQERCGGLLGQHLVAMGACTMEHVREALAAQRGPAAVPAGGRDLRPAR